MLTDGDVIEDNKLCDARSNCPLVCKYWTPGCVRKVAYSIPSRNMPHTPIFCFTGS